MAPSTGMGGQLWRSINKIKSVLSARVGRREGETTGLGRGEAYIGWR